MKMHEFLLDAGENRDGGDEAQGLVQLVLVQLGIVYGWVESASEDAVRIIELKKVHPDTLESTNVGDYVLTINTQHIITARYADLNEVPKQGSF